MAWHHKVLRVAYNRGWIPLFLKGKAIATVLNYIMCESHRETQFHKSVVSTC